MHSGSDFNEFWMPRCSQNWNKNDPKCNMGTKRLEARFYSYLQWICNVLGSLGTDFKTKCHRKSTAKSCSKFDPHFWNSVVRCWVKGLQKSIKKRSQQKNLEMHQKMSQAWSQNGTQRAPDFDDCSNFSHPENRCNQNLVFRTILEASGGLLVILGELFGAFGKVTF